MFIYNLTRQNVNLLNMEVVPTAHFIAPGSGCVMQLLGALQQVVNCRKRNNNVLICKVTL